MVWAKPQSEKRRSIALALLKKHPAEAHRTLAKKLHNDHPLLFSGIETARSMLRKLTGNHGKNSRKSPALPRAPRKPGELPPLPKSEATKWEPYVIAAAKTLVLNDIHLPYHDEQAIDAALDFADEYQPDVIFINGDLFDFYQISRFDKDPSKPKLLAELEAGKQFFEHLSARFPKAKKKFKLGNHDERWDLYLQRTAPLLWEVEEVRDAWKVRAGIFANDVEVIADQRPVMFGGLMALHGHEKGRGISSPVNPARGAFLRLLTSTLEGHGHRTSEHTERTADGRVISCRTTGCLCGLWPEYARVNKWDHSFATIDLSGDEYRLNVHKIVGGKVY